jgi:hypothetical protein
VAGTVFRTPLSQQPVGGVEVRLLDAAQRWFVAYTNCAGSFFVLPAEYEPVLPLWVSLSGYGTSVDMESAMNRDGDCGACHQGDKGPASAGRIFLTDDPGRVDSVPSRSCGGMQP